ncbi:recombinase family protein [Cytobacillus sp. FJAT-54145]|uniref:Recombinase family protein n=1 Tax=Cytobacillus spartinae TaxID=3299023 RepID=A0ABW6KLM2_9BACI
MIAIYVRVSTEEQATKGYSIENQIEECIKKAGTSDVLKYIDEGFTGEIINRPNLTKLRDDVAKGTIDKIICYDPDRLSRKLMIQLLLDDEFSKKGVQLVFVRGEYTNDPEGKMFFSMRGAISEFEKSKIKERTSGGRRRKAKNGLVVKNSHLYGYNFDREKNTYVINEDEAKFVRMIFDYYTKGTFKGINGIANHLTEIGAPTKKRAKVWHRQVVRQMLMNEAYSGTYIQNRYDTEGDYVRKQAGEKVEYGRVKPQEEWIITEIPAIITKEQFEYAQLLLDQGRRRHANGSFHKYLLSGLVRCGRCGCTMTGRRTLSHGKDFFIYECRKNYAGAKTNGCGRQMSENKLNKIVWEHIIKIINNPEEVKDYKEQDEKTYIQDEMDHLEKEIEKIKKGRKRLFTLVSLSEDEDMDLEEIKDQIRELQQKEKDLQHKYNELSDEIKLQDKDANGTALEEAIDYYLINKANDFTYEQKQTLIRKVVREVVIVDSETVYIHIF